MVAPVTGPVNRNWTYKGPPTILGYAPTWAYGGRVYYRQRKPYDLPLEYEMLSTTVDSFHCSNGTVYAVCDIGAIVGPATAGADSARNKAYEKLVSDIGDASLWAVNLVEYKQSINLIAQDGIILWRFAQALNRYDFRKAARILKTNVPKGLKATAKAFGNNFLKFHFGWEPLVKDIGAAVETLENPIKSKRINGKGSHRAVGRTTFDVNGSPVKWLDVTKCRTGCTVEVINPNLYLAQQLGFTNPLAVAWELVPFSFVVDWFVNVGSFLGQMTDFAGLSVTRPYNTILIVSKGTASGIPSQPDAAYSVTYTSTYERRLPILIGPTLHVRPWKGVSPVRAATAISLLVQQLR